MDTDSFALGFQTTDLIKDLKNLKEKHDKFNFSNSKNTRTPHTYICLKTQKYFINFQATHTRTAWIGSDLCIGEEEYDYEQKKTRKNRKRF